MAVKLVEPERVASMFESTKHDVGIGNVNVVPMNLG